MLGSFVLLQEPGPFGEEDFHVSEPPFYLDSAILA